MGRPKGKSDLGTVDAVTRCRLWLTTAALALAGCAGPFPQSTLRPRSDYGRAIDHLFTDIFWWAVIVFVIVIFNIPFPLPGTVQMKGKKNG